jgi:hypothetical protein
MECIGGRHGPTKTKKKKRERKQFETPRQTKETVGSNEENNGRNVAKGSLVKEVSSKT